MTLPVSSVISAVRRSHSIWSNGLTFASLNTRSMRKDFFVVPMLLLGLRVAVTVVARRRFWDGAEVKTSSRASIMVFFVFDKAWVCILHWLSKGNDTATKYS